METNLSAGDAGFQLCLRGPMTFDHRLELEELIIQAMRRHRSLKVDLTDVPEIDLYGVHLLGLLRNVGADISISPELEEMSNRLLTSYRRASQALGRGLHRDAAAVH